MGCVSFPLMSVEDAESLLLDKTSAFRAWMVYRPLVGVETHRRQLFSALRVERPGLLIATQRSVLRCIRCLR